MATDWFEPVRAYCERTDAGFWAEPLNAVSNGAFLVAAILLVARERKAVPRDPVARGFAWLVGLIGIGSFLFHTLAVRWSMLADVIPIALFIHAYFFLALRRFLGLGALASAVGTIAFAAFGVGLAPALDTLTGRSVTDLTNGSIGYLPAILALAGIAVAVALKRGPHDLVLRLCGVAGLFLVSLTFRTFDQAVCPSLPLGTHFLWHILNATVLYGLVAAAMAHRTAARP